MKFTAMTNQSELRHRIERKIFAWLIIPITFITFINSIDRVNVSYAGHALSAELALGPDEFGIGISMFFLAYLIFQYPHARMLKTLGIRLWLFLSMTVWGISSLWMSRINSIEEFYAARFLLGMAEAGFAPGMTWLIAQWVPPWARARAMASVLIAVPLSMVLGGPLCGWLLGLEAPFGMSAWRSMFLVMAFPNFVLAILAGIYFADKPSKASWLNSEEQAFLEKELAVSSDSTGHNRSIGEIISEPWLWRCAVTWLLIMTGSYALVYWLPQLVRDLALGDNEFIIATISALPLVGLALGLVFNSKHSDSTGERLLHVGIPSAAAGVAMFVAAIFDSNWTILLLLSLAGFGIGAAQGVFWTIPTFVKLGGKQTPLGAIALISMFGTMGGIVGPWMIGEILKRTGSFSMAIAILAGLLVLALFVIAYEQLKRKQAIPENTGEPSLK